MNGAVLLLIAGLCFLAGYFLYARRIEKLLGIDPSRPTPAHTKKDGIDYVPAHPAVLFGHHFAAIAGAGPIVGPVLAAEFGWVPVTLWIVLGCIFIGAAHDFISMYLSVRHDGESIGSVIGNVLGAPGKFLFLLLSWSALILVIAEFNRQIAGTFVTDPAIATASLLFIAEAIVFGLCVYRFKMPVGLASLIFVPLMFAFVWVGNQFPLDLVALLGCSTDTARVIWTFILVAYCFFASICPVQYLLQPRDYLNAYLLYAMMALGILGVLFVGPTIQIDAFAGFSAVGRTGAKDLLFPFLFVTVACGACSGFHALVASGTSSKQLSNERSIRPIAYGGMLLEGVLAMIALIGIACSYGSQAEYVQALQSHEPVQLFASSIAGFCVKFGLSKRVAESFMLLSVSAFLMTSVDAGTRLARFSFQEMFPKFDKILPMSPKAAKLYSFAFMIFATLLVCVLALVLLIGSAETSKQLWTLFASTNQLLASLTLLTVTLWFLKKAKSALYTFLPMLFMFAVSSWALISILISAFAKGEWVRFGASAFLLGLALVLIIFASFSAITTFMRQFSGKSIACILIVFGFIGISQADCLDDLLPRPRTVARGVSAVAELPNRPGAYRLTIRKGNPVIAGDAEGQRYARITFGQLKMLAGKGGRIPDCTIVDWPEFKYRGLLLDCGRNYQSVESIRDFIDHLAKYKYNVFHWHIADDYGWRLESKKHPELQSEKAFGRQVGKFYTQKEFVETVRYAKKRGVMVILELDMPGHTLAFRRGTGFSSLATEEAKIVLGELIDEACALLPKEDLPIIHLGTDEAREPGEKVPQSHLDYWAKKVTDNGRILMGWSPGLRLPGQSIKHLWRGANDPRGDKCPYIDSQNLFYINHVDAEAILSVAAYQQPCRWGSPEEKLGAIACVWHDDNIAETEDVARMNFVYPALTLLSDSFWNGCADEPDLYGRLPRPDDPRFARAAELERRLLAQRDKVLSKLKHPFPYVAQTAMRWKMTDAETGEVIATDIPQATIYPNHFWYPAGSYLKKTNGTVILETWITSTREIDCGAWIGMTGFSRSDGRSRDAPTPKRGEWNKHGATIELNGEKIAPPEWTHPGVGGNPKEQPLTDEDYWYRAPVRIHLKKGVNHVKMTLPKKGGWKWIGTFVPVLGTSDHPKEVDLTYAAHF